MISSAALSQLIHRLRNANARYAHIALLHRSVLRCTYHAKRRARWSGLHIDILKAQTCPSRHVSLRSLPVIDADPQPVPEKPAFFVPPMSTSVHALGLELTNLPEIVVSSPASSSTSPQHQLQRLTVRVPPPRLNYAYPDLLHMHIGDGSVPLIAPGAPRLKPMQLPDEDGVDAMDACVGYHPLSSGVWRIYTHFPTTMALTWLTRVIPKGARDAERRRRYLRRSQDRRSLSLYETEDSRCR